MCSEASRWCYRTRGDAYLPMVVRTPWGGGVHGGQHHSQSIEAYYAHMPGIKVVAPAFPADYRSLLRAAIDDPNPVLFLEHKRTYRLIRQEVDGARTLSRSAHAYVADGSWIQAAAYDNSGDGRFEQTGKIPLTIDDLVRIVTDPRLRVSTPAPPDTPAPPEGCRRPFGSNGEMNAPRIDREQAQRLDSVLATIDLGGPRLNPLQPGGSPNSLLCSDNRDVKGAAGLYISITGGQPLPTPERPVPGSSGQQEMRTLPDGTVVQTHQSSGSISTTNSSDNSKRETTNSVEVTRPGGTQISVSSSAAVPNPPLSLEELESIALTDGLEL